MKLFDIKKPTDFEFEECQTQVFQKRDTTTTSGHFYWYWHCFGCHTGTQKTRLHPDGYQVSKHVKGHRLQSDAFMGAAMHAKAVVKVKQERAWLEWWWKTFLNTDDPDYFVALWKVRYGETFHIREDKDIRELMELMQNDPRNPMVKRYRRVGA